MSDPRIAAFQEAKQVWDEAVFITYKAKIPKLRKLDLLGMFSTSQLAHIGRISPSASRNEELGRGVTGGNFHPSALTTLIMLRKQVIMNEGISRELLRACVYAGCSLTVVARLIGISSSSAYYVYEKGN